ncbi:hypothetical protein N7512_003884 [Penicillium capsulatum]|nr:hypothetical protein N7512_003884 [Penicillium capsulatum]
MVKRPELVIRSIRSGIEANPNMTFAEPNLSAVSDIIHGAFHPSQDVALILGKTEGENIDWVDDFCKSFACTPYTYSLEETPEKGFLAANSSIGHEANAYLTYIVNHYDRLHPYSIFVHGMRDQWHNDVGGVRTNEQLSNLRFEAIDANGYINLRCQADPGCPEFIYLKHPGPVTIAMKYLIDVFPQQYAEIFGVDPSTAPKHVGASCCAQFAVTRDRIHQRPREDYERMLNWVTSTNSTDSFGVGWMMEKLWHIVFQMPAVNCPSVDQCRCDLYGWCGPHPGVQGVLQPIGPQATSTRV